MPRRGIRPKAPKRRRSRHRRCRWPPSEGVHVAAGYPLAGAEATERRRSRRRTNQRARKVSAMNHREVSNRPAIIRGLLPFVSAGIVMALLCLTSCAPAQSPPKGLWLLPRKISENTARADVPGNMKTAPKEVWRFGGDPGSYVYLAPVKVKGRDLYLAQVRSGLRLIAPDGTIVWSQNKLGVSSVLAVEDFDGDGEAEALVTLGGPGRAVRSADRRAPLDLGPRRQDRSPAPIKSGGTAASPTLSAFPKTPCRVSALISRAMRGSPRSSGSTRTTATGRVTGPRSCWPTWTTTACRTSC